MSDCRYEDHCECADPPQAELAALREVEKAARKAAYWVPVGPASDGLDRSLQALDAIRAKAKP